MFGMHAIYLEDKIVFILRQKGLRPETNGVWLATHKEDHESLKKDIAGLTAIFQDKKGKKETEWQLISSSDDQFENSVIKVCELVKQHDPRIGRIPKAKRPKNKSK